MLVDLSTRNLQYVVCSSVGALTPVLAAAVRCVVGRYLWAGRQWPCSGPTRPSVQLYYRIVHACMYLQDLYLVLMLRYSCQH